MKQSEKYDILQYAVYLLIDDKVGGGFDCVIGEGLCSIKGHLYTSKELYDLWSRLVDYKNIAEMNEKKEEEDNGKGNTKTTK